MPPRDKYTVFSRHEKGYRKGIHKVPKWTRVRLSPSPCPAHQSLPVLVLLFTRPHADAIYIVNLEDEPQRLLILFAVIRCIIHSSIMEACCRPSGVPYEGPCEEACV